MALEQQGGSPFLGRQMASQQQSMSAETRALIDSEVSRLVSGESAPLQVNDSASLGGSGELAGWAGGGVERREYLSRRFYE